MGNIAIAIGINEMVFKRAAKYFQSMMILPTFISYIAVAFIDDLRGVSDRREGVLWQGAYGSHGRGGAGQV